MTHVLELIFFYSEGTEHENQHRLGITVSRLIYIILRADTGNGVGHSQQTHTHTPKTKKQKKATRERFWKNAGEWTGRVETGKKEVHGRSRSKHGFILTCSKFKRENLLALGSQKKGP